MVVFSTTDSFCSFVCLFFADSAVCANFPQLRLINVFFPPGSDQVVVVVAVFCDVMLLLLVVDTAFFDLFVLFFLHKVATDV